MHHSAGVNTADFEFLDGNDNYIRPMCTQERPNLTELIWLIKTINTKKYS